VAEATPAGPEEADAAESNGLVLDFDITGLVNGTGEQPTIVPHETTAAPEPTAPEPTAPEAGGTPPPGGELKPLSAADLEAIRWRLDGGTLREVVDDRDALRELGERLDEPIAAETDHVARAGLLSVRAEVYRLLGELGMAAAASRLALAHAETAGDAQSLVISQAELAHVLRLRGDFGEADRLFEQAASSEAPEVLRSVVHENAGRCCFDQGRHMEALDHFGRAVRLGRPDDTDLAERIEVSLEAVYIHVLRDGWGPYPRLRREIISSRRPDPAGGESA
jgi:tetratricopeptide (TPR) repeat protein